MTDEQRMAAGLINQQQFEELKGLLKTKGIDPKKWKVWLGVNADGAKSISKIKAADYLKIKDIVTTHPEYIMNPGRVETPSHQLGD